MKIRIPIKIDLMWIVIFTNLVIIVMFLNFGNKYFSEIEENKNLILKLSEINTKLKILEEKYFDVKYKNQVLREELSNYLITKYRNDDIK